jgi:mRNA interferase MazF
MIKDGMMNKFNQREIVLIPFPYSDLTGSMLRPAIIISNLNLNKSQDRLCCLITSQPTKDGLLINKKSFEYGKLPLKSWVKTYRVFTINENIIKKKLCKVNVTFFNEILSDLNKYIKIID